MPSYLDSLPLEMCANSLTIPEKKAFIISFKVTTVQKEMKMYKII